MVPSCWTITAPVSLDLQPSLDLQASGSTGGPAPLGLDLQASVSTGPGSMALDLQPSATGPVSLELGHSNVEFEFESMSPRWAGR